MSQHIRQVSKDVVHRISSGQVVIDLATAVKELVENALDAGASNIEVKLKEYGSELIEVADDGSGVSKVDLEGLALKHHTSKLSNIMDLQTLASFGFRGEALSSLCAVSELMVTTRTAGDVTGSRVAYDSSGRISSQVSIARSKGTTVALKELFKPLPVRRKELLRNVRREYGKLLGLLQAYAVIATGVRIICTNQIGTGPRMKALSTQGGSGMRDNIANVFGPRTVEALMPLEAPLGDVAHASGYISKGGAAFGKSGGDKQYFFINGRPMNLPKFIKGLNDTHRGCATGGLSSSGRPMAFIDLQMPKDNYDINLSPDKRKALIQKEQALLELFQEALVQAWQPLNTSLEQPLSQAVLDNFTEPQRAQKQVDHDSTPGGVSTSEEVSSASSSSSGETLPKATPMPSINTLPRASRHRRDADQQEDASRPRGDGPLLLPQRQSPQEFAGSTLQDSPADVEQQESLFNSSPQSTTHHLTAPQLSTLDAKPENSSEADARNEQQPEQRRSPPAAGDGQAKGDSAPSRKRSRHHMEFKLEDSFLGNERQSQQQQSMTMCLDLEALTASSTTLPQPVDARESVHFSAASLQDPAQAVSEAADKEIQRVFQKEDFARMHIIGQFNLGFILARLGNNLFIIDQHAADEKYNFERLQQITRLNKQPLMQPLPLDLTPAEKMTLWQEQHVFLANGFNFRELEDGKVQLTAVPFSKEAVFGPQDVHELLHLLAHGEGGAFKMQTQQSATPSQPILAPQAAGTMTKIVRPSRVRDMLAMRACRSSIMIGKALNRVQMQTILLHLSQLESPWNCPHGRPTMRHLHTLPQQKESQEQSSQQPGL